MLNRDTDEAGSPAPAAEHPEPAKLRCVGLRPRLVSLGGQIDEAQYRGGRAFQNDWERAERGPAGGRSEQRICRRCAGPRADHRRPAKVALRLNRIERELGADGSALVHKVLVDGMTMELVGQRRGLATQRWKDYFSRRFQECLDRLALIYGFATEQRRSHLNPAGVHRVQAVHRSGE
jgi:hypothetical protein